MLEEKLHCPQCDAVDVVPVVFGYPSTDLEAKARLGEVVLGGCLCWGDERDPTWGCRSCGFLFGGTEELEHLLAKAVPLIADELEVLALERNLGWVNERDHLQPVSRDV